MAGSAYFLLESPVSTGLGRSIASAGNPIIGGSPFSEFIIGVSDDTAVAAIILTGASSSAAGIPEDGGALGRITFSTSVSDGPTSAALGGFDFNGDGTDDIAIGAPDANEVYVIFGNDSLIANGDLTAADLDGTNGVIISGPAGSGFGSSLAAANLDGIDGDELIIGAPTAEDSENGGSAVVTSNGNATITVSAFDVTGISEGDALGTAVANLGDINGDGIDDVAIGAPNVNGTPDNGAAYVVFGSAAGNPLDGLDLTTLDGTNGFAVTGAAATNFAGTQVSGAGDLGGDAAQDFLVSAPTGGARGQVHLIFGDLTGFDATIDLASLDAADGLTFTADVLGLTGVGVGDVSGDGQDDLLFTGTDEAGLGKAYLVYGSTLNADVDLDTLDGTNGITFTNFDVGSFDQVMTGASLGDINNDGINDIAFGSADADNREGRVIGLLGGTENFAALDTVDGAGDGMIDLAGFTGVAPPTVDFVETDESVTLGGANSGSIDLRIADQTSVDGTILILDDNDPNANFDVTAGDTPEGVGIYGTIIVSDDGDVDDGTDDWVYRLNNNYLSALAFLGAGEMLQDRVLLTASNNSQRTITITITGKDDPTVVALTPDDNGVGLTEDVASVSGVLTVTDADQNDNPDLTGQSIDGTYGTIIIGEGGAYTYVVTEDLPDQVFGADLAEVITTTVGGIEVTINLTIAGRNEDPTDAAEGSLYALTGDGATAFFGAGDEGVVGTIGNDTIDTGAGNDVVDGGAGNDTISDSFGNDTVTAGAGNDTVQLLSGTNTITDGGDPTDSNYFNGGVGSDTITGGDGNDVIDGDAASSLIGAADRLDGGAGNDVLRGGLGTDTFVFRLGSGQDRIANFSSVTGGDTTDFQANGQTRDFNVLLDIIELGGFTGIDAANVLDNVTDIGGNATFGVGVDTLTLVGITSDELTSDNFTFV